MAIRRALAAVIDASLVALLGYLGFRVAVPASGCHDLSSCPPLTPLIIGLTVVLVATYFLAGYGLWRSTFGQRILGVSSVTADNDR